MSLCAVYKCNNSSRNTTRVMYHRFPKNRKMCKLWVKACCRKDKFKANTSRICSEHFKPESYKRDFTILSKHVRNLKPDAVPTEKLPRKHKEIVAKIIEEKIISSSSSTDNINSSITSATNKERENTDTGLLIKNLTMRIEKLEGNEKLLKNKIEQLENKLEKQELLLKTANLDKKLQPVTLKVLTPAQINCISKIN